MTKATERQAIALKYDGENAPNLTAKGNDELAEEILQIAREYDVPIYENADLVRLLARLELGDAIPESLYQTVGEIIAFAWYLTGRGRKGVYPQQASEDSTWLVPRHPRDTEDDSK